MARLSDRPAPDLIVFALTALVGVILFLTTIAVIVSSLWFPSHDVSVLSGTIGRIMASLIAAIVGYLAGRGVTDQGGKVE